MNAFKKIVWTDGLFLRPQHFQQAERYLERYVELRHAAPGSHAWGFDELEIDHDLLAIGRLGLHRARGVFPDGTPFSMPDRDPLPPPLAIDAEWRDRTVCLALPLRHACAAESTWNDGAPMARFDVGETEQPDASGTVEQTATLQVGRLRAVLVVEGRSLDGFGALPLARLVERRADGRAVLDDGFIPAVRCCAASPRLVRFGEELLGLLRQRGDALASRPVEAGPVDAGMLRDLLLLQAINGWQPRVAHMVGQSSLHPESFWCFLAAMAGELTTFAPARRRTPAFPSYRHEHLRECFDPVIDALRSGLQALLAGTAIEISLRHREHGLWMGALHEAIKAGCNAFALAATSSLEPSELRRRLPGQAKLGPAERIRDLVNLQLPGVAITPMDAAPRGVFSGTGWQHFAIDVESMLWKTVQSSRVVALHVGDGIEGLSWRLWAWKA
ncbi:type VI secretion system baseplate subunit TssK [Luteibacter aegosomatis]|uniref:type VI secretion system baseplate subunit TssK n=1 Tax=Luteibacter aegosomatis TaxID=2911537 RepID=UPI001FF70919|nr:type VI secretion system baseplate subunit TssK [Luteibacter aegosomatis]UPG84770.1 type VI secretion system baseplate subunit TssK [Luteibacter aegosomatis]